MALNTRIIEKIYIVYLIQINALHFAEGINLQNDAIAQFSSLARNLIPDEVKFTQGIFTSLAVKYGHFPVQYEVVTADGYVLTMFRFKGKSRFPVFLMHGILDSSETWLVRGENSLGITLANDDYDVWLGNSRGNRYSRRHVKLNPDTDPDFWKFSFNEVGYYDLPAFIDKIINETGVQSVTAIAHSQGNTAFFVLGATRPEYNKKINVMIALSPVSYLQHSPNPSATLIKIYPIIEKKLIAIYELFGDNTPLEKIARSTCTKPNVGYEICVMGVIFPITGFDAAELEPSFFSMIANHVPAGTSSMSVLHYLQIGRRKTFAKYDYGVTNNNAVYNSSTPPVYNLSMVTMPIALFASRNDYLCTLPDVTHLKEQLPNVVYYLVNPFVKLNHLDYVWGKHMHQYLFPYIYQLLRQYNGFD